MTNRRDFFRSCAAGALTLLAGGAESGRAASADSLDDAFLHPSGTARAKTWWHWVNGNVTADGITRDLEAIKSVGLGGVQLFQVGLFGPTGPVKYGSPEHLELLQHAARECDRLGLEFAMHNCPGWSSSGGPWITPDRSMQVLTWSTLAVTGGNKIDMILPRPKALRNYYRDAMVLAFPCVGGDGPIESRFRRGSTPDGPVDLALLAGGAAGVEVRPAIAGTPVWLQLDCVAPVEARSITFKIAALGRSMLGEASFQPGHVISLQSSLDGATFQTVCDIQPVRGDPFGSQGPPLPVTANFKAVQASHFRIVSSQPCRLSDVWLSGAPRLEDWAALANFVKSTESGKASGAGLPGFAIDPETVVDVSSTMNSEGRLEWQAPSGNWTILRIGHTTTGRQNSPAPGPGTGLEADKFSSAAYDFHFEKMFGPLESVLRPLAARGLAGAVIDSYEAGMQNWTAAFPEEFGKRRGYDLHKYMPAMFGWVVESTEASHRFLRDFRRTQADLVADNFYGRFAELCRQHGMKSWVEPYDAGPFDEMQSGSRADTPMGEFWVAQKPQRSVKLAASIAHVYGKRVVGAECFTAVQQSGRWQQHPYALKSLGDYMYTQGLNQFIIHRYAHQPHPTAAPGMTMGPYGLHFERTNTWWNQAAAWLDYAARCQGTLQQGRFVGDLLYFQGEDAPLRPPTAAELYPPPPPGYDWDTIDAGAVLNRIAIQGDRIVLPDGMSYRVLVLPKTASLTLPLLRKIRDLVNEGMTLVGPKAGGSPSLADRPHDPEVRRLADEVWGDLDGTTKTERPFGKGRVFCGMPLERVLERLAVAPDFEFTSRSGDATIHWIHRRAADADIYFVANRRRRTDDLLCTFRLAGRQPEFWNPVTGERANAAVWQVENGRTRVAIELEPVGSLLVVFRSQAPARSVVSVMKDGTEIVSTRAFEGRPHQDVQNNFTIALWVKPEMDTLLAPEQSEFVPVNYVLAPPSGQKLYGSGHAACGMAVGRNGIAVYERSDGEPGNVLTAAVPVAGWTHVALAYRDRTPSIYVGGKLVRTGNRSHGIVHPGISPGELPFEGGVTEPVLSRSALGEDAIARLAAAGLPAPDDPPALDASGLFWKNGAYTLRDSRGRTSSLQVSDVAEPLRIDGPWEVSFQPDRGAPPKINMPELISWHRHPDPGVKFFSGVAAYRKRIKVPAIANRLFLDLGRVEVIAEVILNGMSAGTVWKPPYRVDITEMVRPGDNDLEIRVVNLWPNRLIGDEELPPENEYSGIDAGMGGFGALFAGKIARLPDWYVQGKPKPAGGRVAFTTWRFFRKGDPLYESGLLGPVRLRTAVRRSISIF